MPTGYTSKLYDGNQDFSEFAMSCARAFAVLIEMRDDGMDAKIPDEFKPSDYNIKALAKAESDLHETEAMTPREAAKAAAAEYKRRMCEWEKNTAEIIRRKSRYDAMAKQAAGWTPPSDDHAKLKKFMLEQLLSSIEHDCHSIDKPRIVSPRDYREELTSEAKRDIKYHRDAIGKERGRAEEKTSWVRLLRRSLGISIGK